MDISRILAKKIKYPLSKEEQKYLEDWLAESNENRVLYNRIDALGNKENDISYIAGLDDGKAWQEVLDSLGTKKEEKEKDTAVLSRTLLKYAALFIGILGLGYGYWKGNRSTDQSDSQTEDAITLQLGNGEVQVISPQDSRTITDQKGKVLGTQQGNQLDYLDSGETGELSYNVLTVPYGKRFSLVLSDGTTVHLNAGSSLEYPVNFLKGENRQVFLTGEGYFDVSADKEHPFVVTSANMDIRVLGTQFNVSAYPEDRHINTVLVEGSVSLYGTEDEYDQEETNILEPGYKAEWDRFYSKIEYEPVDTDIYTGWIDGKLVIKKMPFKNIVKKLQRYYNVSINNTYGKLDSEVFTATFDVETIGEALNIFMEETPFDYKVNGDKITIYKIETEE